jgi:probable phosphoglycerate mutase
MTLFNLVRHGSHDLLGRVLTGRTADTGLNPAGHGEARRLAQRFASRNIDAVYTSGLKRALETAGPIGEALGTAPIVDPRFGEIDFGDWSGQTFDALNEDPRWRRWNAFRGGTRAPGGETIVAAQARIVSAMVDLRDRYGAAELVIVSHADLIKAALAFWAGTPLDLLRRIDIAPASVSRVSLDADGVLILGLNEPPAGPA